MITCLMPCRQAQTHHRFIDRQDQETHTSKARKKDKALAGFSNVMETLEIFSEHREKALQLVSMKRTE